MFRNSTALTAALLVTSVLAGCGTNRFSRDQYASLSADPFLVAETPASSPIGGRSPAITADAAGESREESPSQQKWADSGDTATPLVKSAAVIADPSAPPSGVDSFASVKSDFGRPPVTPAAVASAADAGDGFDAWLQENNSQVVQASGEFQEAADAAAGTVSRRVQQAAFSGFPGKRPAFDDLIESSAEKPMDDNPFASMDAASTAPAEATGDLSFDDEDAWSPPSGFEF